MEEKIVVVGKRTIDQTPEVAIKLREEGWTLERIAEDWHVTRQRVAQIIKAYKKKQK